MKHGAGGTGKMAAPGAGRILGCAVSRLVLVAGVTTLVPALPAQEAQQREQAPAAGMERIRTRADDMTFDRKANLVIGEGNVIVRKGDTILMADRVQVNTVLEIAEAEGNVRIMRGDQEWTGDSVTYNFQTGEGATFGLAGGMGPFRLESDEVNRGSDGRMYLSDAVVTTCENEPGHRHFHVSAKSVEMARDDYVIARGGVWHFGNLPLAYLPYWKKNLNDDFGWTFVPGHNSRMGTFLLSSYRYRINPSLKGRTHFDVRTERGLAVGQDFAWTEARGLNEGDIRIYYADDQEPVDDDEDAETADIDNGRYRIRFRDSYTFSARDSLNIYAHTLSDTDIIEDFFDDEYETERQPDNYISYAHRGDGHAVNVLVRSRLDDFFEGVNRLPEVSLDVFRRQVGESSFYYESETAAANLERVFPDGSTREDYESFRFDTEHTVLRPGKHFGFLNLTPRAGIRGTYYSKTRREETVNAGISSSELVVLDGVTNTVFTGTVTNTTTRITETGSKFRTSFELGFETSLKAFKSWEQNGESRRHIVEPYAKYTLRPEPGVTPDELYQFDRVDRLDESHVVKLGVRNKLQAKREKGPHDLVDIDMYTFYDFDPDSGDDALETFYWDGELRPSRKVAVDFDGRYSLQEAELEVFNTELSLRQKDVYRASVEYRFRNERNSLLFGDLTLLPGAPWSYNLYARQEFEDSRFEEGGGFVERTLDCLVYRVGFSTLPGYTRSDGSEVDDEWRVTLEFWLTAFPKIGLSGKHKQGG